MWKRRLLAGKPKRSWVHYVVVALGLCFVAVAGLAVGFIDQVIRIESVGLPDVADLAHHQPSLTTRIYSSDGKVIATLYKENRVWVPLSRIPTSLTAAFLASEDSRFYQHHGVDPVGVARSIMANLVGGREEGASTLTMQLARGVFLTPERTVERKIKEMLLAVEIERHYSKNEILELYLNEIYLGSGAYGVEAAAETYFGKHVQQLTLPQAAMIAGLPPAPTSYSPHVDPHMARERQWLVLRRMEQCGMISDRDVLVAERAPVHVVSAKRQVAMLKYPYFTSYVIRQLSQQFSPHLLYGGGLRIYTTLDTRMQTLGEKAVQNGIDNAEKSGYNVHQGALVSIEPSTGYVRAMIGGRRWSVRDQFNRAWQAERQPGSTFKIFVYSTAFELGFTPDSIILDEPQAFHVADGQAAYVPKNSDGRFWGAMPIWRAMQFSRDVPALRLANQLGLTNVIRMAQAMGLNEHFELNLPIALGCTEVNPLELASAVSTLPNMGVHVTPTVIKTVKDPEGHLLADYRTPERHQVVTEQTAMAMIGMMEKVIAAGTGTEAQIGRPAGGKTGTTDSHRDAWFVGFTPDLSTAVWTGNDDYSVTYGAFGGTVAAPIWADFMKGALAHVPPHDFGVQQNKEVGVLMCLDSHERAGATCPNTVRVFYPADKIPEKFCPLHTLHDVGSGFGFVNRYRFSVTGYASWMPDMRGYHYTFPPNYVSWDLHPHADRTLANRPHTPVALQPPLPPVVPAPAWHPRPRPVAVVHFRSERADTGRARRHAEPVNVPPSFTPVALPPPVMAPAPPVQMAPPPPPRPRVRYTPPAPPPQEDTPPIFRPSRQDEDMDFEHQR